MNFKWSKFLSLYFFSVLSLAIAISFVGFFVFKERGSKSLQSVATIYESSLLMEGLSQKDIVSDIQAMVQGDRARIAIRKLDDLKSKTTELNKIFEVNEYENFQKSLQGSRSHINALIKYPEMGKISSVLHEKMIRFERWVQSRGWRTLTRMSRRINSQLSSQSVRGRSAYQERKMNQMILGVEKDIKRMAQVTKQSILGKRDKALIISRIDAFTKEVELLKGFVKTLRKSDKTFENLKTTFELWKRAVNPQISLSRLELERSDKAWQNAFLGTGSLLLILLAIGGGLIIVTARRNKAQVEELILETIQDRLFPHKAQIENIFSQKFLDRFLKLREFFHKRVVFGSVFQEAVPFSCFLLDSNLNLVWGNDLFYQHWNVDKEDGSKNISWNFLSQSTNLGEDDPVMCALKQGIAGIYQIQMKEKDSELGRPFEMYVSPVDYSEQKRIMIFLYPLSSLQDTIQDQTRSMISPMKRAFDALTTEKFNEVKGVLEKDFDVAGIGEVFSKIEAYSDLTTNQKNSLLGEIDRLESELQDKIKLSQDLHGIRSETPAIFEQIKENFLNSKKSIVESIELQQRLETLTERSFATLRSIQEEEKDVVSQSMKANQLIQQNLKAFSSLGNMRDGFKQMGSETKEIKVSITQGIDQLIFLAKREEKIDSQKLSKIKEDMKHLESFVLGLEKMIRGFDVGLSKVEMMLSDCESVETQELHRSLIASNKTVEEVSKSFLETTEKLDLVGENLISGFKNIYDCTNSLKDIERESELIRNRSLSQVGEEPVSHI